MVVNGIGYVSGSRPRGNEQGRHPEAEPSVGVSGGHVGSRNGRDRRSNMIEEPTPLVVVHDEHGVWPSAAQRHGLVNEIEKGLTVTYVGMWMIVIRQSFFFELEARIDEGNRRQVVGDTVDQKLGKGRG